MPSKNKTKPVAFQETSVESSNIQKVGYDSDKLELYVTFHSGKTYIYKRVKIEVYKAMIAAESVGSYFIANVKTKYVFVQK